MLIRGATAAEFTPDASSVWERAKAANAKSKAFETMRDHQSLEFPDEPIALALIGDQHLGGTGTDYAALEHDARTVAKTPGMYAVLMGDAVNNFVFAKLAHARAADALNLDEQWIALKHYLTFFLDTHGQTKIVAVVSGNHEQWTPRVAGVDVLRGLVPEKALYDTDQILTTIKVGAFSSGWLLRHKVRYNSVYNALHGTKQTLRLGQFDPDVIVSAHVHRGATYEVFWHQDKKRLGILTGTYKTTDAYARTEGFGGGGKGNCVTVVISPDGTMQPFDDITMAAAFLEFKRLMWRSR